MCTYCGDTFVEGNFYRSNSKVNKATGHLSICKKCVGEMFDELLLQYKDEKTTLYKLCEQLNVPFYQKAYDGAQTTAEKRKLKIYQTYFSKINSFGDVNGYGSCFAAGESLDVNKKSIVDANGNVDLTLTEDIGKNTELTDEDKKIKTDVIRLMGYDPFYGYAVFDQKFLYSELLQYLDEDTLDDTFKLSQIIQIVNNNNQVRKMDLVINSLSSNIKAIISNNGDIQSLSKIKNQIVQNTDKIAKENSISVKNRGDQKAGKSTLTYIMKNYRELGFEDAEQDYYDQNKANGMKLVADISNRSILDQLQLDENDINDMIIQQRELIQRLQTKVDDLEEENRQLYVKISKYDVNNK